MRTIVVTGAAGGIGRATLPRLAAPDVHLLCIDASAAALERLDLHALPGEASVAAAVLADAGECRRLLDPHRGRVAGLVHLAGVFETDPRGIDDMAVYDRAIAHNLTNAYLMAHAVHEARAPGRPGAMVFISSSAFRRGAPDHVPYGIAKAGLVGLTRSLGRRFAPDWRVNALAPGLIDTAMPAAVLRERGSTAAAGVPLGRIGRPEEVAGAIAFLMSGEASFISCQTINVDGGMLHS